MTFICPHGRGDQCFDPLCKISKLEETIAEYKNLFKEIIEDVSEIGEIQDNTIEKIEKITKD